MRTLAVVISGLFAACGAPPPPPPAGGPSAPPPNAPPACSGLAPAEGCTVAGKPGVEVCASGTVLCATTVVSLTFDDALAQQLTAAATLEKHGMRGTFFLNTWRLRTPGPENMTPAQAKDLQDRGHEIGGHTLDHPHLTALSRGQQYVQICNDRANLLTLGLDVQNFAYPFGDWNSSVRQAVADCGYNSARDIAGLSVDVAAETFAPKDALVLRAPRSVQWNDTVADLEALVTRAEGSGGWLVFTFHQVCDGCAAHGIRPGDLEAFLAWLEQRAAQGTGTARVRDVIGGSTQPAVTW